MMNRFLITAILFLSFHKVQGQEVLIPLSGNPVIKEYIRKNPPGQVSGLRRAGGSLSLPFQDDFSGSGIYPNSQLWSDSNAFVNQTYPIEPVTIGVATLDGIDKYGNPHDSLSTAVQPVICDYLTSLPIDVSPYTISDSVYFSFYYQPQGHGDEPEEEDSLALEFYSFNGTDSSWVHMWSMTGSPDSAFKEVRIKLESQNYFWGGFRFRFYNYANPNGNRDHWNIDYVRLGANETYNQPLREIALVNPIPSYLKDFSAMPYSHYKYQVASGSNPVKSSVEDIVRLYTFTGTTSLTLNDTVRARNGSLSFGAQSLPDLNPSQNSTDTFQIALPPHIQVFDTISGDMTDFYIKHSFSGLLAGDTSNDASHATQHFYNYYSYDDGTAESSTGVHVAYTKYAYKYDVKKSDSLLGISIYFNPWGKNVHLDLFSLCLWSNVDVTSNSESLVYQMIDNKPANNDSINGFVDYYFDEPQWVNAGTNYIGIIQSSINEIGLGVDRNNDNHDKMFLNYNNQWYQSVISGSWMMRPIFGKKLTIGVDELSTAQKDFTISPNPASQSVSVERNSIVGKTSVQIYSVLGEKILESEFSSRSQRLDIDVNTLPSGVYLIGLVNEAGMLSMKKLVISH